MHGISQSVSPYPQKGYTVGRCGHIPSSVDRGFGSPMGHCWCRGAPAGQSLCPPTDSASSPCRLHPNAGHPRRDRESRRGACGFRELRGPLPPSCAPRKNTPGEANSGASSVPSAREHWKELPTAPAGSGAPRTPGAAGKLGGNRPQHLLLVSRSYTTDASFSCLLPSTLGKFIYLLFISYTGSGEI